MKKHIKFALAGLTLFVLLTAYLIGFKQGRAAGIEMQAAFNAPEVVEYTGMDVWNELNAFRASKGLNQLALSEVSCNNIGARWDEILTNYRATGLLSHDGALEFRAKQENLGVWPIGYSPSELINIGATSAKETISGLTSSPGHYLALADPDNKYGCAYSGGRLTVIYLHPEK
jgi:uncharacterized protein YkwD